VSLSIHDHDRRKSGRKYVYAVLGRRAGGVSVGVNLNTNSACNWRCAYCEIPDLVFGNAPHADLVLLERELRELLEEIVRGDWLDRNVPDAAMRVLKDVAISGNGEPTSCPEFPEVVALIGRVLADLGLAGGAGQDVRAGSGGRVPIVLITNGSLVHKPEVQRGLVALAALGGVVWYKLDSATAEGQARMNDAHAGVERARENLERAARLCPTWIQTMALARNGEPPSRAEQDAYLELLRGLVEDSVPVKGVLLYGFARPSYQKEAPELSALPRAWMEDYARRIEATGLPVKLAV
jgi:wyosine [tRNA(Phe)-imidazoG37] synthetase (radical SAM superfamily)